MVGKPSREQPQLLLVNPGDPATIGAPTIVGARVPSISGSGGLQAQTTGGRAAVFLANRCASTTPVNDVTIW